MTGVLRCSSICVCRVRLCILSWLMLSVYDGGVKVWMNVVSDGVQALLHVHSGSSLIDYYYKSCQFPQSNFGT